VKLLIALSVSLLIPLVGAKGQGVGYDGDPSNPHIARSVKVENSCVTLRYSGVLQDNDSQFVSDIICIATGKKIGTVRMRWAHKYGARYGGVGVVLEGDIEEVWRGDSGWITVKISNGEGCEEVTISPRLLKIPD
jgi:hypothetical protein